jgi:hypothetical protein
MIILKERKFKMPIKTIKIDPIGMGQYEMVEKAIELIQEAKELMDIVMDSDSRLSREYYAYNEAGIQQALGNGNPYDMSLPKILKEIEENGEV